MNLKQFYETIGVNYDNVLRRLRKESLIEKYLMMFQQDQTIYLLTAAREGYDYEQMFRAAHTLKGMAMNLELTPLAMAAADLTEYLRSRNPEDCRIVDEKYEKVMTEYKIIQNLLQ